MSYTPTIGLEIHAELKTATKMFCSCKNDPDEARPNVNICPICLAHPGTLPTINREAVRHVLRVGAALKGELADFSEFDRKSYFYPDIPKGFQISQYEHPLVKGGTLAGVAVTRVHLEEDTARSSHAKGKSLVDFNRAGIPLMELVTEPVIHDAETAGKFARELQLLLRTLGAGEANLEKGEMRIEVNMSVSAKEGEFGTKVEVKNLNSFRSVERAITYEVGRQIKALEKGEGLRQETRGWNEAKQETFHQRFKEGSADYRYFPEPDIPKLFLSEVSELMADAVRKSLPELPWERRERYQKAYELPESTIQYLTDDNARSAFFDAVAGALKNEKKLVTLAANYVSSDLAGIYAKSGKETYESFDPNHLAKLMRMISAGDVSSRGAKDVLAVMAMNGDDPESIAKEKGMLQVHDTGALQKIVDAVLREEEKAVGEYRAGKTASLQYLIGKSMKASKGAGNPELL